MPWVPVASAAPDRGSSTASKACALVEAGERSSPSQRPSRAVPQQPTAHGKAFPQAHRMSWADMLSDSDSDPPCEADLAGAVAMSSSACITAPIVKSTVDDAQKDSCNGDVSTSVDAGTNGESHGSNDSDFRAAEKWASQVREMAEHLRDLAMVAPSCGPTVQNAEVATEAVMEDLHRWEMSAFQFANSHSELSAIRSRAEAVSAEAFEEEMECLEARRAAHDAAIQARDAKARAEAASAKEHNFLCVSVAAVVASLAAAQATTLSALGEVRTFADARERALDALIAEVMNREQEAAEAEAEALRALEARDQLNSLPLNEKKRIAREAQAALAAEECAQLRRTIDQVRTELNAVPFAANAKAETMKKRIAQLEQDCQALQDSSSALPLRSAGQFARTAYAANEHALKLAQESNRQLVTQVRQARSDRDETNEALLQLEGEVAAVQERCLQDVVACADLQSQYSDLVGREAAARSEVLRLRESIEHFEQEVHAAEETAKKARERHDEVDAAKRQLVLARRHAEEQAGFLEWRLQKAVAQLDKEKPGAPLVRCLLPSGPAAGTTVHGPTSRAPRAKRLGGHLRSGQPGGSEADAESTTAGESAAEGLLAEDHMIDGMQ